MEMCGGSGGGVYVAMLCQPDRCSLLSLDQSLSILHPSQQQTNNNWVKTGYLCALCPALSLAISTIDFAIFSFYFFPRMAGSLLIFTLS
jgi:hypothetical protein